MLFFSLSRSILYSWTVLILILLVASHLERSLSTFSYFFSSFFYFVNCKCGYNSVWKNPYKCISTDRIYFYCICRTFMTSICREKNGRSTAFLCWTNAFIKFHHFMNKNKPSSRKASLNRLKSMGFCKLYSVRKLYVLFWSILNLMAVLTIEYLK